MQPVEHAGSMTRKIMVLFGSSAADPNLADHARL
jgi:hypothetical protein